jgi:hypothetical protein
MGYMMIEATAAVIKIKKLDSMREGRKEKISAGRKERSVCSLSPPIW